MKISSRILNCGIKSIVEEKPILEKEKRKRKINFYRIKRSTIYLNKQTKASILIKFQNLKAIFVVLIRHLIATINNALLPLVNYSSQAREDSAKIQQHLSTKMSPLKLALVTIPLTFLAKMLSNNNNFLSIITTIPFFFKDNKDSCIPPWWVTLYAFPKICNQVAHHS